MHESGFKIKPGSDMIGRHFKTKDAEEFNIRCDSYMRTHMEYCVQVWSPYLRKYIKCLERVQMSATKMMKDGV